MLAPNPVKTYPALSAFVAAFRDWRRQRWLLCQNRVRLDACDRHEVDRIAHDLGMSSSELCNLSDKGPNAAEEVLDRLNALHLDAKAIATSEPATMRDLQRLCSKCPSKRRCRHDLLLCPDDPVWRQYCLNADTLDDLKAEFTNGG
jgi:hypothetical protein